MRVRPTLSGSTATSSKQTKTQAPEKDSKGIFARELGQQQDTADRYREEVEILRKEIETTGDKLSDEPTLGNFSKFRDALGRLARRISNEAYRLEKFGGTPENPRYYEIINVINHEADRLYRLILQEQRDNLAITAQVIGIKGMVVDLMT